MSRREFSDEELAREIAAYTAHPLEEVEESVKTGLRNPGLRAEAADNITTLQKSYLDIGLDYRYMAQVNLGALLLFGANRQRVFLGKPIHLSLQDHAIIDRFAQVSHPLLFGQNLNEAVDRLNQVPLPDIAACEHGDYDNFSQEVLVVVDSSVRRLKTLFPTSLADPRVTGRTKAAFESVSAIREISGRLAEADSPMFGGERYQIIRPMRRIELACNRYLRPKQWWEKALRLD